VTGFCKLKVVSKEMVQIWRQYLKYVCKTDVLSYRAADYLCSSLNLNHIEKTFQIKVLHLDEIHNLCYIPNFFKMKKVILQQLYNVPEDL